MPLVGTTAVRRSNRRRLGRRLTDTSSLFFLCKFIFRTRKKKMEAQKCLLAKNKVPFDCV